MGVDLRLLPVDSHIPGHSTGNCHTILNAPRSYDMFDDLRIVATRLPDGHDFTSYLGGSSPVGEPCYGRLDRDAYGELYTWIRADVLGPILWKHYPAHPVSAYIAALTPETMIVLDWH